jgi:hypothetical protein
MAVREDHAGQGIGARLVRELINEARAIQGLTQITLSLTKGNASAERLYRASGFEVHGYEPRATFIDGACYDKQMMVFRLEKAAGALAAIPLA